jgi:hypothetical protein
MKKEEEVKVPLQWLKRLDSLIIGIQNQQDAVKQHQYIAQLLGYLESVKLLLPEDNT